MKYEYARKHYSGEKDKTNGRFIKKHGCNKERLYKIWVDIKYRCYNPKSKCYSDYGGRGIKICREWDVDYMAFREWAYKNGYIPNAERGKCTLDRINVNGDYEPSNCRWIDNVMQNNNKRNNRHVEYKGKRYTVAELAREKGVKYSLLLKRIHSGWELEDALSKPSRKSATGGKDK